MEKELLLQQIWKYISQFEFLVMFTPEDVGINKGLLLSLASQDYLFYCKDRGAFMLTERGAAEIGQ